MAGWAIRLAQFSTRQAKEHERALHKMLDIFRRPLTPERRASLLIGKVGFIFLSFFLIKSYTLLSTGELYLIVAILGRLSVCFAAQVKIGISNNTERRVQTINEDVSSGFTEWFLIPWILLPLVPLVTWTRISPAKASLGVFIGCFFIFWIVKHL